MKNAQLIRKEAGKEEIMNKEQMGQMENKWQDNLN